MTSTSQQKSYRTPRELQYWLDVAPQAMVPTFGVRHNRVTGELDTSLAKKPIFPWGDRPNGYHPNVLKTYIKSYLQNPLSVGWAIHAGRAGLMIIDVDPRHGGDESFARLIAEHGEFPVTPRDRTGGGGWHLYFRQPEWMGAGFPAVTKLDGYPGIEIFANNHLTQIPPSWHPSGTPHRWDVGFDPLSINPSETAEWLDEHLHRTLREKLSAAAVYDANQRQFIEYRRTHRITGNRPEDRGRAYLDKCPPAISGHGGHNHTVAIIASFISSAFCADLDERQIADLLCEWDSRNLPPWNRPYIEREVRKCVAKGMKGAKPDRTPEAWREDEDRSRRIKVNAFVGKRPEKTISKQAEPTQPAVATPASCKGCGDSPQTCSCHRWPRFNIEDISTAFANIEAAPTKDTHAKVAESAERIAKMRHFEYPCAKPITISRLLVYASGDARINFWNPRCDCWDCPACSHLHRAEWTENYRLRLEFGKTYWVVEHYGNDKHRSITGKIHRRDGEFVWVYSEDKSCRTIVSDVEFPGAKAVTRDRAIAILTACLSLNHAVSPVGSSTAWEIPKPPPRENGDGPVFAKTIGIRVGDDLFDEAFYEEIRATCKREIRLRETPYDLRYKMRHLRSLVVTGLSAQTINDLQDVIKPTRRRLAPESIKLFVFDWSMVEQNDDASDCRTASYNECVCNPINTSKSDGLETNYGDLVAIGASLDGERWRS